MQKIVIASNNQHKVDEIGAMVRGKFELVSLSEIGCTDDIPEDADTLEGNAYQKARYVFARYGLQCFADDTGLEVEALNGRPGVYSARFSEDEAPNIPSDERSQYNIKKLLRQLNAHTNRKAAFRTVICLLDEKGPIYFEGKIEGHIIDEQRGSGGFGYDPVFVPVGHDKTFAELPIELKNTISHRALATKKLIEYLLS